MLKRSISEMDMSHKNLDLKRQNTSTYDINDHGTGPLLDSDSIDEMDGK